MSADGSAAKDANCFSLVVQDIAVQPFHEDIVAVVWGKMYLHISPLGTP